MATFQPDRLPARLSVRDLLDRINATTTQVRLILDGDHVAVVPTSGLDEPESPDIELLDDLTPPPRLVAMRDPPTGLPVSITIVPVAKSS